MLTWIGIPTSHVFLSCLILTFDLRAGVACQPLKQATRAGGRTAHHSKMKPKCVPMPDCCWCFESRRPTSRSRLGAAPPCGQPVLPIRPISRGGRRPRRESVVDRGTRRRDPLHRSYAVLLGCLACVEAGGEYRSLSPFIMTHILRWLHPCRSNVSSNMEITSKAGRLHIDSARRIGARSASPHFISTTPFGTRH